MYLGGHKLLKVLFSSRKKRHKLLNFGTLTIENSTCPPKYLSGPLGHHRSSGCLWPPLAASGRLWPPLAASGRLWPPLAASGRLKVHFSCRKKRHKLLNFGTLTIVNIVT